MVITLPVMYPILTKAGFDPIWLGVIAIKLAEVSLITPPVGLNVYVVRSASPIPLKLEEGVRGRDAVPRHRHTDPAAADRDPGDQSAAALADALTAAGGSSARSSPAS